MLETCEENSFVFQETFQSCWNDHVLRVRLQPAPSSITCLGLPKIRYLNPKDTLASDPDILEGLSNKDPDFLLDIFKANKWLLSSPLLPEHTQKNPKFIDFSMKNNRLGTFVKDPECIKKCLEIDGNNLAHLSKDEQRNLEYISIALSKNPEACIHVKNESLRAHLSQHSNKEPKNFSNSLLDSSALARWFPFAKPADKANPWCVQNAVRYLPYNIFFATKEIQENYPLPEGKSLKDFQSASPNDGKLEALLWEGKNAQEIQDCLRKNPKLYWCAPPSIKDLTFSLELSKIDPSVLLFLSTFYIFTFEMLRLIENPDFYELFNKNDPLTFSINPDKRSIYVTRNAIEAYPSLFMFAPDTLKNDEEIALYCLDKHFEMYYFLSETLKNNFDFVCKAFFKDDPYIFRSSLFNLLISVNEDMAFKIRDHYISNTEYLRKKQAKDFEETLEREKEYFAHFAMKKEKEEEHDRIRSAKKKSTPSYYSEPNNNSSKTSSSSSKNTDRPPTPEPKETSDEESDSYFDLNEFAPTLLNQINNFENTYPDNKATEPTFIQEARGHLPSLKTALTQIRKLHSREEKAREQLSETWTQKHFKKRSDFLKLWSSLHSDKTRSETEHNQEVASELYKIFTQIKK